MNLKQILIKIAMREFELDPVKVCLWKSRRHSHPECKYRYMLSEQDTYRIFVQLHASAHKQVHKYKHNI